MKSKVKNLILKQAIKYIVWFSKDSNYVKHALSEFDIAWGEKDEMQDFMCKQVIELLSLLSTHGDSGFSIGYKLNLFDKLVKFKIISPLTFDDDEFREPYCLEGTRQNKRNSSVFKNKDGKFTYNDDVIHTAKYYIGEDNIVEPMNGGSYSGRILVLKKNGEMFYLSNLYIKDTKKFIAEPIYINTYDIECPRGWWICICKECDTKNVFDKYILEKEDNELIEKELSYKDGKYRNDIIKKIEIVGKHMYGGNFKLKLK